jgi:hypothetical protein
MTQTTNENRTPKQRQMIIVLVGLSMLIGVPYVLWVGWYGSVHHRFPPRGEVAIFYAATLGIGYVIVRLVWKYKFNKGKDDDSR